VDHWLAMYLGREGVPFASLIGMVDGPAEVQHDDIYR
jgi:hypothetical protein